MVLRLLLVVVTALTTSSGQHTFYITPFHNATCPGLPCLTLSEYTAQARTSSTTNADLVFLAGNHILKDSILIRNSTTFLMSGDSTSLPSLRSVIICAPLAPVALDFENVTFVSIFALVFTGCGIQQPEVSVRALLHAEYVLNFSVNACSFVDNGFIIALSFRATLAQISNCSFINNRARLASGMLAVNSYIQFRGSNCFTNNSATTLCSAIYSEAGHVTFISSDGIPAYYKDHEEKCLPGTVSFVDNSVNVNGNGACCGGAVCMFDSLLQLFGMSSWLHNFYRNLPPFGTPPPFFAGGALFGENSTIFLAGDHLFAFNHASTGGAIFISKTTLNTTGSLTMENNSAYVSGAIHAVRSVYDTYGEGGIIFFTNNSAQIFAGSTTFSYSQVYIRGNISIQNNSAEITAVNIHLSNITVYGRATFMNNRAILGTALYVDTSFVRFVGITSFVNNVASAPTTLNLHQSTIEFTGNVTFSDNRNRGALSAVQSDVIINGTALISNNHGSTGGGVWMILSHFFLYGSIVFENNHAETAGGALAAYNSTVHLGAGNVSFINNSAPQGGGLFLQALSRLIFNPPLQMYARHNMADRGAAVFVEDVVTFNFCSPIIAPLFPLSEERTKCFFSSTEGEHHNTSQIILLFENNDATIAGTTLYGGMLDTCLLVNSEQQSKNALQIFNESLSTTLQFRNDPTSVISSDPFQLCFCLNNTNCSTRFVEVFARRGQKIHLHVIAVGQGNGSVPAVVRAQFPTITFSNSFLGESEEIQSAGKMCTDLQYTVFSPDNSVEFIMYADGPCRDLGDSSLTIRVHLLPCPIGFQLSAATCICDSTIQPYTNSCSASDGIIKRSSSDNFWIGVVYRNNSYVGLIVHANCPFDYCRNEKTSINLNNSDSQCSFNRTGILCGACVRGLSLTLGTSHCSQCSSTFVLLLLPLVLAGVLLIMLLLLLKLTVAVGTINGLIFYANIVAVKSSIFFPDNNSFSISKLFISWLNLDLGITTCFYNGMDAYAKVWLQFLFPAYVWLMMGAMITASHYSSRAAQLFGRNPVAVLSTLLLLSYAKMLRTIIAIFSFTFIQYPDKHREAVWLYDGNVQYVQGKHIPLFIMALAFLLCLFIPYTLYLTFGQCIMAKSNTRPFSWLSGLKIRPFLDAYYSPFTAKHRYWLGLLLLYRCALFLVTAFNTSGDASVNLLAISSSLLGLLALRWLNGLVYKRWYLDALETLFIVNLGLLSVGTCHVLLVGGNQAIAVNLSVGIAFAAFSGIILYHIFRQVKDLPLYKQLCAILVRFKSPAPKEQAPSSEHTQSEITSEVVVTSTVVTSTVVPDPQHASFQLRESLLDTCT